MQMEKLLISIPESLALHKAMSDWDVTVADGLDDESCITCWPHCR